MRVYLASIWAWNVTFWGEILPCPGVCVTNRSQKRMVRPSFQRQVHVCLEACHESQ